MSRRLASTTAGSPDGRPAPASDTPSPSEDALLPALLAAMPDVVVLCDRWLRPVRAGAAAQWLVGAGGEWSHAPEAAGAGASLRAVAAAALDANGIASLDFEIRGTRWMARAAPLHHPVAAVVIVARPASSDGSRETVVRATHDLKGPLHAIGGFARLLLREMAGPLTADQRRFLETIDSEVGRLRRQLERLLEVARFGVAPAGVALPGPSTELVVVIEETAARLAGAAALKGVRLTLQLTPDAPGPPTSPRVALPEPELHTLFENLLTNALAATPAGGTIEVALPPAPAGLVRCTLADTGPGIPPNALERIFEPYARLPDRGAPGGTGLGLAICHALVEARGGRLTAANRPGGGAIFTVDLPAAESAVRQEPLLRLAPVPTHAALAAAADALDRELAGRWQPRRWSAGVLDVAVDGGAPEIERVAAQLSRATAFACWVAWTSMGEADPPRQGSPE